MFTFCSEEKLRRVLSISGSMVSPLFISSQPLFHFRLEQNIYNLACFGALLGKSDSARKYLEEAIEIEPSRKADASNDPDLVLLF